MLFPDVADENIEKIKNLQDEILPIIGDEGSSIKETKDKEIKLIELKSMTQGKKDGIRGSVGSKVDTGFMDMIDYLKREIAKNPLP